MKYFKLSITGKNKIWKKYFSFSYRFLLNNNDISFTEYHKLNIFDNLKILALNHQGDVVKDISFFTKEQMPLFRQITNIYLIREDIFRKDIFSDAKGVRFLNVDVEGTFPFKYKLLYFCNVLDCVDFKNSIRTSFDFSSKLILDKTKIPSNISGFFLSNWHNYGQFYSIVNEELKEMLLNLEKSSDFLLFERIG